MPHNTGCNRLIQDGRATIICSLAEIDELCHSAHRPQHVDLPDDTEHPQESTDESDDAILAAIKTCAEANGHVSADDLLDLMDKTHPGEYPVSRIMRELAPWSLKAASACGPDGSSPSSDSRPGTSTSAASNVRGHTLCENRWYESEAC